MLNIILEIVVLLGYVTLSCEVKQSKYRSLTVFYNVVIWIMAMVGRIVYMAQCDSR